MLFRPWAAGSQVVYRHNALVRVTHWVNAACFVLLLMSGLQIFNAHPALNFGERTNFKAPLLAINSLEDSPGGVTGELDLSGWRIPTTGVLGASSDGEGGVAARAFPEWATLPSIQDLATGRRIHFFFAWLLVINGAVYLGNLLLRRHIKDFLPSRGEWATIPRSIWDHARLRFPKGDEARHYNVLQKLAYLSVILALPVLVLAGLTMSPGVDAAFPELVELFGGRQSARAIHFLLATYLVAFLVVHLVMVLISGFANNMTSMITGRYRIEEERDEA